MKYEDLIWESVEGTDYLETSFVIDDKEIKIKKLDEDSFVIFIDGEIKKETDLINLSKQLIDDNFFTSIPESDKSPELIDREKYSLEKIKQWYEHEWTKHPEYGYPYLEVNSNNFGGMVLQIVKLDDDSYKIRGVLNTDDAKNVNWNEQNKETTLYAFAHAIDADPITFMELWREKEKEANTEDVSHTEE